MSFMPRRPALRPWEKRNREDQHARDRVPPLAPRTARELEPCVTCGCPRADHVFYSDDCSCGKCGRFVAKEGS